MAGTTVLNEGIRCHPLPTCAACGGGGDVLHRDLRDVLFGAPGSWNVRRCVNADCGFAWLDPMPHSDDVAKFYETYYTHLPAAATPQPQTPSVRQVTRRALARILRRSRIQLESELMHFGSMRPGRMLDVGCGSGQFLAKASAAGWQVLGIDFDSAAVEQADQLPGVEARVIDIFDATLDDERFDGIAMNNVIEHLADPPRVFARCRELLAVGGRLVMVTPNIEAQCHGEFGANWRGLEVPRHLYLYSARALRKFAADAGLVDLHVFCLPNGGEIDYMVEWSSEIARKCGEKPADVNRRRLKVRNAVMALAGRCVGELVVLVGHNREG